MSFLWTGMRLACGTIFPGGGRPDLHQFLRPMALQQARPAAAHPRELLGAVPGVLRDGGQIHFKTDNRELFEYSLFQFPKAGYELSEVTRDLHGNGVCGIMTDYEEKFHDLGTPINRCVGTKLHLEQEPKFRPIAGPRDLAPQDGGKVLAEDR